MPTPIGHALNALLFYPARPQSRLSNRSILLTLLFFSLLPDFDFLIGFAMGRPNQYHHHFTHSIFFVVIAGLIGAIVAAKNSRARFGAFFVLWSAAGLSHLLLDWLALDTSPPYGVPLLWPFSMRYFISPLPVFSDVTRASESGQFLSSLFSIHNGKTILIELLLLGPILAALHLAKFIKRLKPKHFLNE